MATLAAQIPPSVHHELVRRRVVLSRQADESEDGFLDRLDTALMAVFRDTQIREAFDALYENSRARVFDWLRWLLHEQQAHLDPIDLLQDTFVNVYRYAASFRSEHSGSFRSWVRTIAANVVRRARSAVPRRWIGGSDLLVPELVDVATGPQMRVVNGEESKRLVVAWMLFMQHYSAAFATLSPRDQRALELVEVEGLTYAETGRRLGVGPSNMKMIMLRARRRLHARMRASMFIGHAAAMRTERKSA